MKRAGCDSAVVYRAELLDNLLVFRANYTTFQFCRHAHEEFALGLMEDGVQKFHCGGEDQYAPPGSLITVNAGEVHDGMSADGNSFQYRIIYLPQSLMQQVGEEIVGKKEEYRFRRPVTADGELAGRLAGIFSLMETAVSSALEVQSHFYALLGDLLARHGTVRGCGRERQNIPDAVRRAQSYIADMARENISLDDIAAAAGLSRFHFLRTFTAVKGMTPHSFLVQRRLQIAREALRRGAAIADAALESCFSDQSHFSRKFKAAYGITPKQYKNVFCR